MFQNGIADIFKRLFSRTKRSEENILLATLKRLSDDLRPHNSHWAYVLATFHAKAESEFSGGFQVGQRYLLAREIEGIFGGMGSLNDIEMPEGCQRMKCELFAAVKNVLRLYWRELGRPSYNLQVSLHPIGATVRLMPGKVRWYNRDESPVVVGDTPSVRSETWRVVSIDGNDITNMPSYLIQRENAFMGARHESLELKT